MDFCKWQVILSYNIAYYIGQYLKRIDLEKRLTISLVGLFLILSSERSIVSLISVMGDVGTNDVLVVQTTANELYVDLRRRLSVGCGEV